MLLQARQDQIDRISEPEEQQAQGDGAGEVSLARFEDRGGRQNAGRAAQVSADHQRGADLADDGAEPGHDGGKQRQPRFAREQ